MNSPHNFRPLLHSLHPETLLDPSQLLLGRRMSVRRIQTSGETDRGRVGTNSNGRRRERERKGSEVEARIKRFRITPANQSREGAQFKYLAESLNTREVSDRAFQFLETFVPSGERKKKKRKREIYTCTYAQSVHAPIMPDNGGQKRTAKVGERCWPASSFATLRRGRSENPCGSVRVTSLCYMHGGLHGVAEEYIYIYVGEQQP